jgi:hypothetical protein
MRYSKHAFPVGRSSLLKSLFSVLLMAILLSSLASAGCGRWVVRETTDYLADPLFDVSDPAPLDKGSPTEEENSTNPKQAENSTSSKADALPDLAGKWLVELNESDIGRLELILTQSGDRLQGYGTLAGKGASVHATATGQLSSQKVDLDVKVIEKSLGQEANHYLLNLALANQTLSGLYEMRLGDIIESKGKATASRLSS